jgi:hypothetical protein
MLVNEENPITLKLFGRYKIFTDIEKACVEASWCLNRQVMPFEILEIVNNGGCLEKY